jgi:hypothetical protein
MWTSNLAARLASAALLGLLAFGATGVSGVAAASRDSHHSAVKVAVTPPSNSAISGGTSFADTIVLSNQGHDAARDVTLTVQFDPAVVQLEGVQFDRAGAWVSASMPNGFTADIGGLGSDGDAVSITASFMALGGYSLGNPVQAQLGTSWRDTSGSHSGTTRALLAEAAGQATAPAMTAVNGLVNVNSTVFNPGEAVTFWYNLPEGTAATLYLRDGKLVTEAQHREHQNGTHFVNVDNQTSLIADASGAIAIPFATAGLAPGSYSIVAHGSMSGIDAVIPFTVQ